MKVSIPISIDLVDGSAQDVPMLSEELGSTQEELTRSTQDVPMLSEELGSTREELT